jgi:hypothetical protein
MCRTFLFDCKFPPDSADAIALAAFWTHINVQGPLHLSSLMHTARSGAKKKFAACPVVNFNLAATILVRSYHPISADAPLKHRLRFLSQNAHLPGWTTVLIRVREATILRSTLTPPSVNYLGNIQRPHVSLDRIMLPTSVPRFNTFRLRHAMMQTSTFLAAKHRQRNGHPTTATRVLTPLTSRHLVTTRASYGKDYLPGL